jgi:SAM-dependent methyltransferase
MAEPCQLCGTDAFETVSERDRHGNPLRTVMCRGCGSVTNDPIPTDEELAAFYRSDYRTEYKGVAEPRMRQVWRNFGRLEAHIGANAEFYSGRRKCLDLGSGSGEFMFMAGRLGIECVGVEPNAPYAAYSRDRLGLNVMTQTLEETAFAAGSFDLIRLSHVMEHMREPVRSLKVLRDWLTDDGILYIEVPNVLDEAARKVRGRIFHYGHIFNFSPWTFRAAAGLAGLEELPGSLTRYAEHTMGFFARGGAIAQEAARSAENAARVAEAMAGHNARLVPRPQGGNAVGRGISTTSTRVWEMIAARRFDSPRAIADHFAERLARSAGR